MSFYSTKIFLDQSKKFGLAQNVQDMDQIAKFSSGKLKKVIGNKFLFPVILEQCVPQVGFFDFSAFKSRLWALIKKARSRSLIYDVNILAYHPIPSFG